MKVLATFLSTLALAFRRLWSQKTLMLCLLVGLSVAVGLLSSIPLYAEDVHRRLLQGELTEAGTHRPPFAFLWRYVGTWHGEVSWDDYRPVDVYLSQQAPAATGLPLASLVRHVQTGNLRLFSAADSGAFSEREPLLWTSLGFVTGLEDRIHLVEGAYPRPSGPVVEVLASRALAGQMGLQVGESYVLLGSGQDDRQMALQIAGIWEARDPADPFWFYAPDSFDEVFLTSADVFEAQVVPVLEKPVSLAVWYQLFDGSRVGSADVPGLLGRIAAVEARTEALLGHTSLDASPADSLGAYQSSARLLTVTLTIFAIPVISLILYFVALTAGMVVGRSQGEIAILRGRGTTRLQVLLVFLLEGLLVGAAALALGLTLGWTLAWMMGRTRTFLDPALLDLAAFPGLRGALTPAALAYGLLAVGVAVLALLLPALAASRHTIVTFKWERARALSRPLWQRYYLDLLLLIPVLYGLVLLLSSPAGLLGFRLPSLPAIRSSSLVGDPFSNPLLFLVPSLFCFSLSLLFVRVFPWLVRALAWAARVLPGATVLLILRQLARSTGQYTGPLLLLSLTLSLAIFTASMAATLDGHLDDRVYYQVGADLNLAESGESTEEAEQPSILAQPAPSSPAEDDGGPRWLFLPVSAHLEVPGVRAAARVGDYGATSNIGGRQQSGRLLGVDRIDFPTVAYDYPGLSGGEPLAGHMNRLAPSPANLLVGRDFLAQHRLAVGDPLRLTVSVAGEAQALDFVVAGPLDLFPTLYPQDGPFFVANLDYVFERLGGTFPYDVWLATEPGVPGEKVVAGVRGLGVAVSAASDARAMIAEEQTRPERQGLFGLLSVGFLAAAGLTVLGFLVYAVVSFRRRFIELGMLRAVGLSVGQMGIYLAGEQALLILAGGALGTALGLWASSLFIPFQQVGLDKTDQVPPFAVQIAWGELWTIYALFGAMFVLAVLVLIVLLLRMRIFEAVKLGEAG